MGRIILAIIGLAALAGCTVRQVPPAPDGTASLEWPALRADIRRGFAASYLSTPFAEGPVSVVAADGDDLRTFRLVPCGTDICGGSAHGPRGRLVVTPDYWVVTGLYGREFWLSPGGDGGLRRPGRPDTWLAWNDVADGRLGYDAP